jgi:hypothetical protein
MKGPRKLKKQYYEVRLGHGRVTFVALVDKSRTNVTKMTGNAAYATPKPALADIATASDRLDTAIQAYDFNRGRVEKEERDNAFQELKDLRKELGAYVQSTSNGDQTLITSAGFETERNPHPLGQLPAPPNARAKVTAYPNQVELRYGGVKGRLVYKVSYCAGAPQTEADWVQYTTTGKTRVIFDGLESGKEYFFRVAALGAAGLSPASDVTSAKVA